MSDYDYNPREKPSVYLRLKNKGDEVTVRLASSPYREPTVWMQGSPKPLEEDIIREFDEAKWAEIYRNPDYEVNESFHWEVIDRADGTAKILSSTPGVYKSIKEYAEMPAWGDPQTYDFTIKRTEEPGRSYYKVTPLPNKEPLGRREMQLLDELKISEKKPLAIKLGERQVDYMGAEYGQEHNAPSSSQTTPKSSLELKKDVVIEDGIDEPINLDNIPF